MKIQTSSGFEYAYNPVDNGIVDGVSAVAPEFNIAFKPLEEVAGLPNLSAFTIGVTEQCNLRCSYCCYSGSYSEHRKHSAKRLSIDKIPSIIKFMVDTSSSDVITVDFYGGESLLEFDWIRRFVEMASETDSVDWKFEISTNGLLLTREIADWLVTHQFKLFVSVDGIGHHHDQCRKDAEGRPTFSAIETNLAYIKEHYPQYWDSNVHVMMTIRDITRFPEIAETWELSDLFKDKPPYRIAEVSTVYNAKTPKLDEAAELDRYLQLVEWYKGHPDNSVMKTFFNIWLAEWITRPMGETEREIEYPTCIPYNRKLYIDAAGAIGICERISDKIRFGAVEDGIDFSRLNEIRQQTADFIDQSCTKCEIARVCDLCPDILKIPDDVKDTYCHNQKAMQRIKLRCFCELAENDLI